MQLSHVPVADITAKNSKFTKFTHEVTHSLLKEERKQV